MGDPYRSETIANWIADFVDSPRAAELPGAAREFAPEILVSFLTAACGIRDVEPGDIEEQDLQGALVDGVGRLELPASVREVVPEVVQRFLEALQEEGRLGGGRRLGLYVRALAGAYRDATSHAPKPIVAQATKLGRNDPCPCGSGLKYKRCCMGRLG